LSALGQSKRWKLLLAILLCIQLISIPSIAEAQTSDEISSISAPKQKRQIETAYRTLPVHHVVFAAVVSLIAFLTVREINRTTAAQFQPYADSAVPIRLKHLILYPLKYTSTFVDKAMVSAPLNSNTERGYGPWRIKLHTKPMPKKRNESAERFLRRCCFS